MRRGAARALGPRRRRAARDRLRPRRRARRASSSSTPPESAAAAFQTSAFSLKALADRDAAADEGRRERRRHGLRRPGRVAGLRLDGRREGRARGGLALPGARPRAARHARQPRLGRARSGRSPPRGIPGFEQSRGMWSEQAPLGWDPEDPAPVAAAVCFLLSRPRRGDHAARSSTSTAASTRWAGARRVDRDRRGGRAVSRRVVLLTGATGFLGMEVLVRLLERPDTEVRALVRADDREGARRASTTCWRRCGTTRRPTASACARCPASSTSPGLGSRPASARRWPPSVDAVLHCAASVSFALPLDEARAINVDGTRRGARPRPRGAPASSASCTSRPRTWPACAAARFRERRARRRPALPQHLRADQVGGRAARARDAGDLAPCVVRP